MPLLNRHFALLDAAPGIWLSHARRMRDDPRERNSDMMHCNRRRWSADLSRSARNPHLYINNRLAGKLVRKRRGLGLPRSTTTLEARSILLRPPPRDVSCGGYNYDLTFIRRPVEGVRRCSWKVGEVIVTSTASRSHAKHSWTPLRVQDKRPVVQIRWHELFQPTSMHLNLNTVLLVHVRAFPCVLSHFVIVFAVLELWIALTVSFKLISC